MVASVIPELVYHKKIWHNRIKDQLDLIELREYARMHNRWDWKILEDTLPKPSLLNRKG